MERFKSRKFILFFIILISVFSMSIFFIIKNNKSEISSNSIEDAEIMRAMTYDSFEEEDKDIEGVDNVKFSAFFLRDLNFDGYAEMYKGTCKQVGKNDTLYMEVNVLNEGYLENAEINIDGKNFKLQTSLPADREILENAISLDTKKIKFKTLNNGTQKLLYGKIYNNIKNNINDYSKSNNKVVLTGTYVVEDIEGNRVVEQEISKEIDLTVDWYGITETKIENKSYINDTINNNIVTTLDIEKREISLTFEVTTIENAEQLLLSTNHVEGTIPLLNEYAPKSVELVNSNISFEYDENTRKFVIEKKSILNENESIITSLPRRNTYKVKVIYPYEAYESAPEDYIKLEIPISEYYTGYNNKNSEFLNPYKSNIDSAIVNVVWREYIPPAEITLPVIGITVGKYLSDPYNDYVVSKQKPLKIYNGTSAKETDDTYTVSWRLYSGSEDFEQKIVLKESNNGNEIISDNLRKSDSSMESMNNFVHNKSIEFTDLNGFLTDDGEILVYNDETDELLLTINKQNFKKYNERVYNFKYPVDHVRVEIKGYNKGKYIRINTIKELDDEYITTNYSESEFDDFKYIFSYLNGYLDNEKFDSVSNRALYTAPFSYATISVSKKTLSTQVVEKNEKITINAEYDYKKNQIGWLDGSFLIKLPNDIIDIKINDISCTNTNVRITSYEIIENEDGTFIKINTENNDENGYNYKIEIECEVTPDFRAVTKNEQIKLYASNENGTKYWNEKPDIYDVNNNQQVEDLVNLTSTDILLVTPSSLLTNTSITDYDDSIENEITIAPKVADVDKNVGNATVNVEINNNYSRTISDIVILGRIPFNGNKYVLSEESLKSDFTTTMTEDGITIPEQLRANAKVYYSENENSTNDINLESNLWKEKDEVTDWSKVKSYLIDLGDTVLNMHDVYDFKYTINLPSGIMYNEESYAAHAVYFALNTEEGKYQTQTEPSKVGVRIAKKYNLNLTKYQKDKEKVISGATYRLSEIEIEENSDNVKYVESFTGLTNNNGIINFKKLYLDRLYEITEIKTLDNYELNEDKIRFIVHENDDGTINVQKQQGNVRGEISVNQQNYTVSISVEDEVKANLKLIKKDKETQAPLNNVKFKISGSGINEGKVIKTNELGEVIFNGLKLGEQYTLEENGIDGYYLLQPIKFKITNNEGTYSVEFDEGNVIQSSVQIENDIPIGIFELENEKIPKYNLNIKKIKNEANIEFSENQDEIPNNNETEQTALEGAIFYLYKSGKKIGEYTTDSNGMITINDLYQYSEDKDFDATYILKEVQTPSGYTAVKDIIFKVEEKDGSLKFIEELTEGQAKKNYTSDLNTVNIVIEDSPTFKLIKKDSETGELLPNIKFAIYNIDEGDTPATNSKGEIIGTKEVINGSTYYVVVTNENGEIVLDLPEGLYKAIEVQAEEKYDIKGKVYYFGIGASREPIKQLFAEFGVALAGESTGEFKSISATKDGGYVAVGSDHSNNITIGDKNYTKGKGGVITKFNKNNEVEFIDSIGSTSTYNSVSGTTDGGVIVGGNYYYNIRIGDYSLYSNSYGADCGMIAKYNSIGNVEYAASIGGGSSNTSLVKCVLGTKDGGVLVGGIFSNRIQLGSDTFVSNGGYDIFILKYNSNFEIEWAQAFGGEASDALTALEETSDNKFIIGGNFYQTITVGEFELENSLSSDGLLIILDNNGEVLSANNIGNDKEVGIKTISMTEDGGYLAGGYYSGELQIGNENLVSNGNVDSMIIKYNNSNEIEWVKNVGGTGIDYIYSIKSLGDGGFIVGGCFKGTLQLGDFKLNASSSNTGMFAKYDNNQNIEYATAIGSGDSEKIINSVDVLNSNENDFVLAGKIVGSVTVGDVYISTNGYSNSKATVLRISNKDIPYLNYRNQEILSYENKASIICADATSDGGYIVGGTSNIGLRKYGPSGELEWNEILPNAVNSVKETNDGGYIVGGSGYDVGVSKYNEDGSLAWNSKINGTVYNVIQTNDNGYVAVGAFSKLLIAGNYKLEGISWDTTLTTEFIIKYDEFGNVEWAKTCETGESNAFYSVAQLLDGTIIVGGTFRRNVSIGQFLYEEVPSTNNPYISVVVKFDLEGNIIGAKKTGYVTLPRKIEATDDGGYIVTGDLGIIYDGDKVISSIGSNYFTSDGFIAKYDSNDNYQWSKQIGNSSNDSYNYSVLTKDGGILAVGYFRGTITVGNNKYTSLGDTDGIIVKYDRNRKIEWSVQIKGVNSESIRAVAELNDGSFILGGYTTSNSIQIGNKTLTKNGSQDAILFRLTPLNGALEQSEVIVENTRNVYNITTDILEIDNIKGGSISGEDEKPYEQVKHGDSSQKEIKIIPDENYEIIEIKVNGDNYSFTPNEDDSFTMPVFENVVDNIHVEVRFALKDNKITINKVDSVTGNRIEQSGISFKLDQLEEREEPSSDVFGNLTNNSKVYESVVASGEAYENVLGELTSEKEYYFIEQDGKYVPTNSKTYQEANGGTSGIHGTTANSYIPIDLTGLTGEYVVEVNAEISSQSYDYGYVTISQDTTAPSYTNLTGRFIYISGSVAAKNYSSSKLTGGQMYYLHLGYRKDGSKDTGDDQIVINSIKVYEARSEFNEYNFVDNNGKYESSNMGIPSTNSASYIPIDLTGLNGMYNLIVNAEVSSMSGDYGYCTITKSTDRVTSYSGTSTFVKINGNIAAKDYTTEIEGGYLYYLHLNYNKNATGDSGDDKFTINSISLSTSGSQLYHSEVIETNLNGQAITQIPFGKYQITEITAPNGYQLAEEPIIVEFRGTTGSIHEFNFPNEKVSKVIVHHKLKDRNGNYTDIKVAEDEYYEGKKDDKYNTYPKSFTTGYELEKANNGEYIIPINSCGEFAYEDIEVNYYYEESKIPLIVHHYIEDTEKPVPLINGDYAEEFIGGGYEGESYVTYPITDEELSSKYELVETPDNSIGEYRGDGVEVTYYYKVVKREITIKKYGEDEEALEGAKFKIEEKDDDVDVIVSDMMSSDQYYFAYEDGKYVSNNYHVNNSRAHSYMKINTQYLDKRVRVIVNALVSSESYDYGYAIITQEEELPSTISRNDCFIYKSGIYSQASNNETVLEPGKIYYLHFGYSKDRNGNSGTDSFTINSIEFKAVKNSLELTSNQNGIINQELEAGDYIVREIEAPEGYVLDSSERIISVGKNNDSNYYEFLNNKEKGTVTVHHYFENTTTPVLKADGSNVEDEVKTGDVGDIYATKPSTDIMNKYEVVSEIVDNMSGKYVDGNIDVYYYYRLKNTSITVQYIEKGTENVMDSLTINGLVDDDYSTEQKDFDGYYFVESVGETSGKLPVEPTNIIYYYSKRNDLSYKVKYLEKDDDTDDSNNIVVHTEKLEEDVLFETVILSRNEIIDVDGYNFVNSSVDSLTIGTGENIITLYYTKGEFGYEVNYFYDGVEDTTEKEESTARFKEKITYQDIIDNFGDKTKDGYVLTDYSPKNSNEELELEISSQRSNNVINIYYRTQFKIETEVIEHTETTKDGETITVTGGAICEEPNKLYETESVLKGDDSEKTIFIVPDSEYEISSITITDKTGKVSLDLDEVIGENGIAVLNKENGFFNDLDSDKKIEVEFRKQSTVVVKYLSATETGDNGEPLVLATEDVITGYESKEFKTGRKPITYYQASSKGITDENENDITEYDRVNLDDNQNAEGTMYSDTLTIIYWYERIPAGILVRHISITEADKKEGLTLESGIELESELLIGETGLEETTYRKEYDKYISEEGPESNDENILIAEKDDNSKNAVYKVADAGNDSEEYVVEIRYYYIKQFNLSTSIIKHEENGEEVKGGTITEEDSDVVEVINQYGENTKQIVITPDYGYKIKHVFKNDKSIDITTFEEDENHSITILESYFVDVDEDLVVSVEFERIPAKVITKYIDVDTGEEIESENIKEGYVNDLYTTESKEIDSYILVEDKTEYPEGEMKEQDIIAKYYYKKQFKITTDVIEHDEVKYIFIESPKGEKQKVEIVNVKGGSISGEDEKPYELVLRGENSENSIKLTPDENYKIISVRINNEEAEIVNENGYTLAKFENIQSDLHVEVKYEAIMSKLKVRYIEEKTGKEINSSDIRIGNIGSEYETKPIDIDNYKFIRVDGKENGKLGNGEYTVTYYYEVVTIPENEPEDKPKEENEDKPKEENEDETKEEIEDKPKDEENDDSDEEIIEEPEDEIDDDPEEVEEKQEEKIEEEPKEEIVEKPEEKSADITENESKVDIIEIPDSKEETTENDVIVTKETVNLTDKKNVKTGDNIIKYIMVLFGSVVLVIIFAVGKRKKQKEDK